ncbi:MAG TPA: hypothetical protein P5204_12520 [Kiritimatiellia bacterium]|nr:hypothetical protein [Kiritimatiellia bacterium]
MKKTTEPRERIRTAQRCKACRKTTEHERMKLIDGTEFIRCVECGQRPDRPKDGHKIKVDCPECGKRTTAIYCDDDGMDTYAVQCDSCGGIMMAYDDLVQSQTDEHKKAMKVAAALAAQFLNHDLHIVGGLKIDRVSVTIGSANATATRKQNAARSAIAKAEGRKP